MNQHGLNRRSFLQCAALLSAGVSVAPSSWAMSPEQEEFVRLKQDFLQQHAASFFSSAHRLTISAIARQIIPTTNTPGADQAQVGRFIELMVQHWFNQAERDAFLSGFDELLALHATPFHQLSHEEQLRSLEALEDQASDADWFNLGNTMRTWDNSAPFICQFKELCVLGFMLSEVGSTQFLTPNPMGSFRGDRELKKNDSAYATQIPIRVLAKAVQ